MAKIKHALARAERAGVAGCDASWAGLVAETEAQGMISKYTTSQPIRDFVVVTMFVVVV